MAVLDSTKPQPFDLTDALTEARDLAALAGWISQARTLCDDIAAVASTDSELGERLRGYQVRYNAAGWDDQAQDGLQWLHSRIQVLMNEALVTKLTEVNHG